MAITELDVLRLAFEDTFSAPGDHLRVTPASLPQDWPASLPCPAAFTLIGSIDAGGEPLHRTAAVYFATDLPTLDAQQQLIGSFLTHGWTAPPPHRVPTRGFLTPEQQTWDRPSGAFPHLLLHEAGRSVAALHARPQEERTIVTVRLEHGSAYDHHARQDQAPSLVLPVLTVPGDLDARTLAGGASASGSSVQAYTLAHLWGPGTTAHLHAHFAGELTRLGWTPRDETGTEAVWASTWQLGAPNGPVLGTLVLTRLDAGGWHAQYSAMQPMPGRDASTAWSSFAF